MRQIKFRALIKEDKRFINFTSIGFADNIVSFIEEYDGGKCERDIWFHIDDIELMQYTGLKDKNGVEIFEGDVVEFIPDGTFGEVKIFNKSLCMGIEWSNPRKSFFTQLSYLECESELNILGNIFQNPELTKEQVD